MSIRRRLSRGLRNLKRPDDARRDISDELQHYLDEAAAEHEARGLTREQALRAARLELGGSVSGVVDRVDSFGWENAVESVFTDLRYALRRLIAEPSFAVVTVVTIAIGIGAATTMFSAVNGVVLRPLPYPGADRVVTVWDVAPDASPLPVTFGTFRELSARSQAFDDLSVFRPWRPALSDVATPQRLQGQRVSAAYFAVLGVAPALGRAFNPAEDRPGGADELILSDALWRRQFGGESDIVGRLVTLDDRPYEVVGVMPPDFVNVPAPSSELWALLQYEMDQGRAWGHHLQMIGRVGGGWTIDETERELGTIAAAPLPETPRPAWAALEQGLNVSSLHEDTTAAVRPALLGVFAAAALLLVIAAVNVTSLLIGRGVRRRAEFTLRLALGAGHKRLVRQLLTESVLMSALGGAAGIGVAWIGVRALSALNPPDLPRVEAVAVDLTVLAFAFVTTTLVGIGAGLTPALRAARGENRPGFATAASGGRTDAPRGRGALMIAQVAIVVVLLVGSGLLLRSMNRLLATDPGFAASGVLTLQLQVSGATFDGDAIDRLYDRALEAIRAVPGVSQASFTSQLPLSGDLDVYGIELVADPDARPEGDVGVFRYSVSPGYGAVMRIPLRRGRWFDDRDRADAVPVAVVSESLAARRFAGADPIGQLVRVGPPDRPPFTVVGIAGDVRQESLAMAQTEAVYTPAAQWHFADSARSFVVRAHASLNRPDALVSAIREAIWTVDPTQPIQRVATMDDLLAASVARRSFVLALLEVFAVAALVLAAGGIYGVYAARVAEREGELGVRAALGATPEQLMSLVLREGLTVSVSGVAIGLGAALALARVLVSLLYEVSRFDPITYVGVTALVVAVGTIACARPAWRAGRIDPMAVLKQRV